MTGSGKERSSGRGTFSLRNAAGAVSVTLAVLLLTQTQCTITPEPTPIAANITGTSEAQVGESVSLTVTVDNATGNVTVSWSIVSGGGFLANTSARTTAYINTSPTIAVIRADVYDSGTDTSASDTFTITVSGSSGDLTVTASASNQAPAIGNTISLLADVGGGVQPYTFQWTQTAGGAGAILQDPDSQTAQATFTASGTFSFQCFVQDDDGNIATSTVDVEVAQGGTTTIANAGPDRTFTLDERKQIVVEVGGVPASVTVPGCSWDFGQTITSTTGNDDTANALPAVIQGTANDSVFSSDLLNTEWSVVAVPTGMDLDDVLLTNPVNTAELQFAIHTGQTASWLAFNRNGTTTTMPGPTVVPGSYTFRFTATNPNGSAAQDDITVRIVGAFAIPAGEYLSPCDVAAGGAPAPTPTANGVTNGIGELTNRVIASDSISYSLLARSQVSGNLVFVLRDTNANGDAVDDQTLNTVSISGTEPTVEVQTVAQISSTAAGTFTLQGRWDAEEADVSVDENNGPLATLHVQPDLPATIDQRTPQDGVKLSPGAPPRFGRISSTTNGAAGQAQVGLMGAHEGAAIFDGPQAICCDLNNDGYSEVLILDEDQDTVRLCSPLIADPTRSANSPLDNTINHDGTLDNDFQFAAVNAPGDGAVADILCCDLNKDGFPDLIVGEALFDEATTAQSLEGRIHVYYHPGSSKTAFRTNPYAGVVPVTVTRADSGDPAVDRRFGWRLACGDFNGDGIDDLIVAAPGDDGSSGAANAPGFVYVIPGSTARYLSTVLDDGNPPVNIPSIKIGGFQNRADGWLFGADIACSDLDANGFADIVVGAPGRPGTVGGVPASLAGAGAVFVIQGVAGIAPITAPTRTYEGDQEDLGFGRKVVCCDFNGDQAEDVVVSAAARAATLPVRGQLTVILSAGSAESFAGDSTAIDSFPRISGAPWDANLGASVCCGDFNKDGFDDILALAPSGNAADQAVVYIAGSASPSVSLQAAAQIIDSTDAAFLEVPDALDPADPASQAVNALLYTGGYCAFCDLNGDKTLDLFWSEDWAADALGALFGRD